MLAAKHQSSSTFDQRYFRNATEKDAGSGESVELSYRIMRDASSRMPDLTSPSTPAVDNSEDRVIRFVDPGTDQEYEALLTEQATLARKRVMQGLTRREDLQLTMVRWALDRVEVARSRVDLDRLSRLAMLHEKLADEINRLVETAAVR